MSVLPEPSEAPADPLPALPKPAESLTRWRAAGEVLLCSGYPTQLVIVALLSAVGVQPVDQGSLSPPSVFIVSAVDTAVLIGLVLTFLARSGERPRDLLVGVRSPTREVWIGLLLVPALFMVMVLTQLLVYTVAPSLHNVPVNPFNAFLQSPALRWAFLILVVIAGGIREEVQRAFLLHRFEQRLGGPAVGLVVTSVAFGLGHTVQGWDAAIITALLGACWGLTYLARRSAIANVVSHATFNVLQVVAGVSSIARS